jgi:predicted RNase H-like nuclease
VDRVAGSLISWLGGGVQPANRSMIGMFDDAAPIWRFKEALGATEDPEGARSATSGLSLIEVFPAMALPTLEAAYFGYKLGPRYNPGRRKTFKLEHWQSVLAAVQRFALLEAGEHGELDREGRGAREAAQG